MKTIPSKRVNKSRIIGLKEFRNNTEVYIRRIQKGEIFVVFRRSQPLFKLRYFDKEELVSINFKDQLKKV